MMQTRLLNKWLGTTYSLDEVSEMDPLILTLLAAIRQGEDPPKGKKPSE